MQLQNEVDDVTFLLDSTRETQTELTTELADLKDKYAEVIELLHDTQEQLRRYDRLGAGNGCGGSNWDLSQQVLLPWATDPAFSSPFTDEISAASLAAELEESLAAEVHDECQQKM